MAKVIGNQSPADDGEMKIKLENALSLNRQMQQQLLVVREKLENLLANVKDNYKANETLLKESIAPRRKRGIGIKGAYLKGGTFYLKGNMFFKDIKCRNCPNTPDYERRKNKENEMFPMDLELQARHVWSTKDKQGVVSGIKEQVIDYLKQSSKKLNVRKNEFNSEKLVKLLNMVPKDFCIDWDNISSYNVQHRHSAKSCEAIWNVFLNPVLKRSAWSDEENEKLLEASQKHNFQNWQAIAQDVGHRSEFQCIVQYQNYVCYMLPELRASKWTKEDDKRLLDVVSKNTIHGVINWSNVMAHFPHKPKTTLQCRYSYSLNPEINRAPFTPEEDLLLLAAVKEYGTQFKCLPRNLFPNRSTVQLRSRYKNTLVHRHNYQPWTLEDDMKLMEFVTENGTKSWLECAKVMLGKHSRISCRTRFLTVKNFLEKNPDSDLESIPRKRVNFKDVITTENWKDKLQELTENPKAKLVNNRRKKMKKGRKKCGTIEEKNEKPKESSSKPDTIKEKKKAPIRSAKNNTVDTNTEKPKAPKRPRKKPVKAVVPYITRLKSNGLKNYNFFKYAYNFIVDQDPCDHISPSSQILTIIRSALNPKISHPIVHYKFDASIPYNVSCNIRTTLQQTYNYQMPQFLPPNWSSAMGFRALCIHAASSDLEDVALPVLDEQTLSTDSNDHIKIFRQRLRTLFYSTALLSRLHPNMVGIDTPLECQDNANLTPISISQTSSEEVLINPSITEHEKIVKRKRLHSSSDNENDNNKTTSKKKCTEIITNIKTEIES